MTRRDKMNAARWAAEHKRRDELVDLRMKRPLTDDELQEEARLENRLKMRVWRQQQREAEARLKDAA